MKLFDDHGRLQTHPCAVCGRPTIFRRCDFCFEKEVTRAVPPLDAPSTTPQPPTTPPLKHARTLDDLTWLADIGQLGGPRDGDEFAATLAAVRSAPEVTPPTRFWSGMCLWCAREIRETRPEDETHRPPLHLIRPCYRHRKALLGLTRWLRNESLYEQFTRQFGFGHGKGGAA